MAKEWTSPYNSFNSMKGIMWREWFEEFAKGMDAQLLPPVQSDIDLSPQCNFNCPHCNAYNIIDNQKSNLSIEHWLNVSDFLKDWGVKSSCVAGGGEPMRHPGLGKFLLRQKENNIQNGLISNGSLMTPELIDIMAATCRYVGISMDAGTNKTFMKLKGISNKKIFSNILVNIAGLVGRIAQTDSECDVAYKYLITHQNAYEIYEAAKIAKDIGVKDFHSRPVGFDNIDKVAGLTNEALADVVDVINEQIEKAMELEDGYFRFFGIRHKFKPNFERKVGFKKCSAIPLVATFCADGKVYLCFDRRGDQTQVLCEHYPDPKAILEVWGSEVHKKMMNDVDPEKCPRCTFGPYNEMVEQVFIKDEMCRFFP